jgi:GGDEF domain-containing protein
VGEQKEKIKRKLAVKVWNCQADIRCESQNVIWIRESSTPPSHPPEEPGVALECYIAAIQNIAHYAVELDAETTEPHVKYVAGLAAEVQAAPSQALPESRARLRGLLRDYRDKAAQFLGRLRQQLESTAKALQETVEALAQSDGEHSTRVRGTLQRVREAAATPEGASLRAMLTAAVNSIEEDLAQMRREQQFRMAQLQTEVRILHQRVESLQNAAAMDQASRFSSRRSIEEYVESLPAAGFMVLILKAHGLAQARAKYGTSIADELAATFARRMRNCVPKDTVMGRWNEQDFLAVLPVSQGRENTDPQAVSAHLSMPYACMMAGKVVRIPLEVSVEVLPAEAPPGTMLRCVEKAFGG